MGVGSYKKEGEEEDWAIFFFSFLNINQIKENGRPAESESESESESKSERK